MSVGQMCISPSKSRSSDCLEIISFVQQLLFLTDQHLPFPMRLALDLMKYLYTTGVRPKDPSISCLRETSGIVVMVG